MKRIELFKKTENGEEYISRFDTAEEASEYVKNELDGSVFDYFTKEVEESTDICDKVKTYADACGVLGIQPMNEDAMKAAGFREDEIARRKLETIVEVLNEGWKPNWNNKEQDKYGVWFWLNPKLNGAGAGLAYAFTHYAPSSTNTYIGSRLCFKTRRAAEYAANTFTHLYEQILVTNW